MLIIEDQNYQIINYTKHTFSQTKHYLVLPHIQ